MTDLARAKNLARQKRRRDRLDEIARAFGFASWSKLETAVLDGSASVVKIPMIEASSITHTARDTD